MTIVDDAGPTLDPRVIRWSGYGLAAAGVAAVGAAALAPSPAITMLALAAPPIPVAIAVIWPQLFQVTSRRRRGFNPIVGAPALALFILGVTTRLVGITPALMFAAGGAALGLVAAFYAVQKPGLASRIDWLIGIAVMGAFYGYGGFGVIDQRFDASAGTQTPVLVAGKHESHGKSTSYMLDLPPWGPMTTSSSVDVSHALYDALQPGDTICMTLHPGALKTPWYTVDVCPGAPVPAAPAATIPSPTPS